MDAEVYFLVVVPFGFDLSTVPQYDPCGQPAGTIAEELCCQCRRVLTTRDIEGEPTKNRVVSCPKCNAKLICTGQVVPVHVNLVVGKHNRVGRFIPISDGQESRPSSGG